MKKQTKSKKKNNLVREYFIPMSKNQLERTHFQRSVHEWVHKKFSFSQKFSDFHMKSDEVSISQFKKKCKEIQRDFLLKHKIQGLISYLPLEYYETLIKYVMQKKLYWTFKMEEGPEINFEAIHKNIEIQMVLELKRYYKNYEYSQNTLSQLQQNKPQKMQYLSPNRTMMQMPFKKANFDFIYELLIMFSVCVVASFFQNFFRELEIDKIFRSEIYIIINHAFLDLEVSQSVYDVMEKKFCTHSNEKNFQSLNTSYVHEFSMIQHKGFQKQPRNPDSKKTIGQDELKSTARLGNQTMTKISRSESKENETKKQISDSFNILPFKGLSSIGFSNLNLGVSNNKKDLLIKPTISIGSCLPSDRQDTNSSDFRNTPNFQLSRFNSFLKDARHMNNPPILQEAFDNGYLPTDEEINFYTTIKNSLHVQALPPIIKKKMNINQYQKLNEVDKLKEIKKEIKEIDQNSRKHNIKSNDLSLAMNAFISTSCDFNRKKRHQRDVQIVTEYLKGNKPTRQIEKKQNRKSLSGSQNKENFQLRKLPFKASKLKFQPHKSCNLYSFNDGIFKIGEASQKKVDFPKTETNLIFSNRKAISQQKKDKFQQLRKSNPSELEQFKQTFESPQSMQETIKKRESEKKRNLERKSYAIKRQSKIKPYGSTSAIGSFAQFKNSDSQNIIPGIKKRTSQKSQDLQQNNEVYQRESFLNNYNLSENMQNYEIGTREVCEIELINENTNLNKHYLRSRALDSEVNVQKDIKTKYKSLCRSFDLKKKLRDFETNCKKRENISNYSMFTINNSKDYSMNYGKMKEIEEIPDEEQSKGRQSEFFV